MDIQGFRFFLMLYICISAINFKGVLKPIVDYKKKSLKKLCFNESYEEIDTRLASGWYVDSFGNSKKKKYKTKEVKYTISKNKKI